MANLVYHSILFLSQKEEASFWEVKTKDVLIVEKIKKGLLVTATLGVGLIGVFSLNANADATYEPNESAYEANDDYISKRVELDDNTWQIMDGNGNLVESGTLETQDKFGSFSITMDYDGNILDTDIRTFENESEFDAWQAEIGVAITEFLDSQEDGDLTNFSGVIKNDLGGVRIFENESEFDAWHEEILELEQSGNIY